MGRGKPIFLLGLALIGGNWGPPAARAKVRVETKVDRQTITVGDPITYTLTITGDPTDQISIPDLGAALREPFTIRDYQEEGPIQDEQGRQIYWVTYVITLYETGAFEIPAVEVEWTPSGGGEQTVTTEPLRIEVQSVYTGDAADIRGAKPPVLIPKDPGRAIRGGVWGVGMLMVLAGLWGLRRWLGRREAPEEIEIAPPRPAHEVAWEALDQLAASDLGTEGRIQELYFSLTDIIRRYLEARFPVAAMERPTNLLIPELEAAGVAPEQVLQIQSFLEVCDLAKFAQYEPSSEETQTHFERAREIVRGTRVRDAEEEQDSPGEGTPVVASGTGAKRA